jgi:microcystin degradation protein MlrC
MIADADAVSAAWLTGIGGAFDRPVGGKQDFLHGPPVRINARVERLGDGDYVTSGSYMTGQHFSMGSTAVLLTGGGVTVVVMERAIPPFHAEQLTVNGIDPRRARIIVAKGAIAWRAAYGELMASAIEVDTPGCTPCNPYELERRNMPQDVEPHMPKMPAARDTKISADPG